MLQSSYQGASSERGARFDFAATTLKYLDRSDGNTPRSFASSAVMGTVMMARRAKFTIAEAPLMASALLRSAPFLVW
jgi:hypothetical protein